MYRQSHPSFGKPSYRVNSLPENYSGNAFSPEIKEKEADSAEKNTALPVAKEHREDSDAGEKKGISLYAAPVCGPVDRCGHGYSVLGPSRTRRGRW